MTVKDKWSHVVIQRGRLSVARDLWQNHLPSWSFSSWLGVTIRTIEIPTWWWMHGICLVFECCWPTGAWATISFCSVWSWGMTSGFHLCAGSCLQSEAARWLGAILEWLRLSHFCWYLWWTHLARCPQGCFDPGEEQFVSEKLFWLSDSGHDCGDCLSL